MYTDQGLSGGDAAWIFIVLPIALVLWILNAWWAYHVAPRDRSWTFCWLTLALGPIGVAAAAVAQPRDPALTVPPGRPVVAGRRRFICPRCGAENDIPESDKSYDCWRCSEHRAVKAPAKETKPAKTAPTGTATSE
jgi:DNA-directed RNA polymerase subunit RPC12/RpoP